MLSKYPCFQRLKYKKASLRFLPSTMTLNCGQNKTPETSWVLGNTIYISWSWNILYICVFAVIWKMLYNSVLSVSCISDTCKNVGLIFPNSSTIHIHIHIHILIIYTCIKRHTVWHSSVNNMCFYFENKVTSLFLMLWLILADFTQLVAPSANGRGDWIRVQMSIKARRGRPILPLLLSHYPPAACLPGGEGELFEMKHW